MPVIFISYRRDDSQDVAGRIYDRLVSRFDRKQVFKDVDNIPLGVSFPTHLQKIVEKTGIILVIIGPRWLTATDAQGRRRLEDPKDFVRVEVEAALRAGIPMIPVLVSHAAMPVADELPGSLQKLIFRNGIKVRPDPDFNNDMERLFSGIDQLGKEWLKLNTASPAEKVPAHSGALLGMARTVVEEPNRGVGAPAQSICEKTTCTTNPPVPSAAVMSHQRKSPKPILLALAFGVITVLAAIVLTVIFWPKGAAPAHTGDDSGSRPPKFSRAEPPPDPSEEERKQNDSNEPGKDHSPKIFVADFKTAYEKKSTLPENWVGDAFRIEKDGDLYGLEVSRPSGVFTAKLPPVAIKGDFYLEASCLVLDHSYYGGNRHTLGITLENREKTALLNFVIDFAGNVSIGDDLLLAPRNYKLGTPIRLLVKREGQKLRLFINDEPIGDKQLLDAPEFHTVRIALSKFPAQSFPRACKLYSLKIGKLP